jgi:RND superfamily putative drug exporter
MRVRLRGGWDPDRRPAAERWAGAVQRRPVIAALLSAGVVLALAVPALGMTLNIPDESAQARDTMGYQSYAIMARGFGPGFDAPLIIAARLPTPDAGTARLTTAPRATPGVAQVTPVMRSSDGQAVILIAYPATGEQDPATNALVNQIRDTVLPQATAGTGIRAYLTGPNAGNVTFANVIGARLPWLIGVVVTLSVLLLLVMFRSVTIAVTAAVTNLLSVFAAYGVLVAVTQDGWGSQLLWFPEKMPITTWVPVFLFVLLFGLSMDYEVFLLSRIREEYDRTGDNAVAVARGLASTAPGDHGRGRDHGGGVLVRRARRRRFGQADRPRPGRRGPDRRHHHPDGPGAGLHGTSRPSQLVAAPATRPRPAQRPPKTRRPACR